jgi:hypothetical protein
MRYVPAVRGDLPEERVPVGEPFRKEADGIEVLLKPLTQEADGQELRYGWMAAENSVIFPIPLQG